MNKEQGLLVGVVAFTAAIWALGGKFEPVAVPTPRAPDAVAGLPPRTAAGTVPRPPAGGRSMFEEYSDLVSPPLVSLEPPPEPPVPLAVPPVRPFPLPGPSTGLRQVLADPATVAEPESVNPDAPLDAPLEIPAAAEDDGKVAPPDLAKFDWVVPKDGLGKRAYGTIEMLPADVAAGRKRFELAADPTLDFTWKQIDPVKGHVVFTAPRFRERVEQVGFADTIENNHGVKRAQMEAGGRRLDEAALRELARWVLDESEKPRYRERRLTACALAAEALHEALRLKPDASVVKELGAVLRRAMDIEQEVLLYDWWLGKQGTTLDPEIRALRGRAYLSLGLPDRARTDYEQSLLAAPDGAVRVRLGDLLLASGREADAKAAEEAFRRAATEGQRGRAAVGEARALLAQGRVSDAESALARVGGSERDAGWFAAQGAVLYCKGDLPGSREHFRAAVEKAGEDDEMRAVARTNLATAVARLAAQASDPKDRRTLGDEAAKAADDARAEDPLNWCWPLVARGWALRAAGSREAAVESLQEATAAEPSEPYPHYLLGELLLRDGRTEEARLRFLDSVRLAPSFPDALGGVGRARGGPPGQAREYLRRAVEIEPKAALWRLLLVNAVLADESLAEGARLEEARRELQALVDKVDRSHPLAYAYLGWVVYRQGDAQGAKDKWNFALQLLPQGGTAGAASGVPVAALRAWLTDSIAAVTRWQNTKIWNDDFHRPDGATVGNGWKETEKQGVKVTVRENGVQFGPDQQVGTERPSVFQEWDVARVLRASAEVTFLPASQNGQGVEFGTWSGNRVLATIGVFRQAASRQAFLLYKPDQRRPAADRVPLEGFEWPEDGKVAVQWIRVDADKGLVGLAINGRSVAIEPGADNQIKARVLPEGESGKPLELPGFIKSRGGKFRLEVATEASPGIEVLARLEAVEVWLDMQ